MIRLSIVQVEKLATADVRLSHHRRAVIRSSRLWYSISNTGLSIPRLQCSLVYRIECDLISSTSLLSIIINAEFFGIAAYSVLQQ